MAQYTTHCPDFNTLSTLKLAALARQQLQCVSQTPPHLPAYNTLHHGQHAHPSIWVRSICKICVFMCTSVLHMSEMQNRRLSSYRPAILLLKVWSFTKHRIPESVICHIWIKSLQVFFFLPMKQTQCSKQLQLDSCRESTAHQERLCCFWRIWIRRFFFVFSSKRHTNVTFIIKVFNT